MFRQPPKFLEPSGHEVIAVRHHSSLFQGHATQGGRVVYQIDEAAYKGLHDRLLSFRKPCFRPVAESPCRYVIADGHAAFLGPIAGYAFSASGKPWPRCIRLEIYRPGCLYSAFLLSCVLSAKGYIDKVRACECRRRTAGEPRECRGITVR